MKIKHYNNSFFEISNGSTKIVCDPWLGNMQDSCTWSYPNISSDKNILNKINPKVLYVSHLHSDHYDEKILKNFKNKKILIIIKKFPDERLKKKLSSLGYKNIKEIVPWKSFTFRNFEFTIIPADVSNTSGLKTKIFYDLDSSIIIYDKIKKICFYNNVDNPLSLRSLKKVKRIAKIKYGGIDIVSVAPRSASEYPQCFLEINRMKERKKIIKKCLERAYNVMKTLGSKKLIPAGGSYIIYGKFHSLQNYVAHPELSEIKKFFKKKKINIYDIDNSNSLTLLSKQKITIERNNKKVSEEKLKILFKKKYEYEKIKINTNLNKLFLKAQTKYLSIISKIKMKIDYQIKFFIYDNLKISMSGKIISKIYKKINLAPSVKKTRNTLELHIDKRLLYMCLMNKINWNMAMGGSSILFKRKPNKFIPDISSSLNFLRAK
ncbi:MBL fold metallo-hydrolase [Candidatus Pelagibacter sp.]|nr:MBL fold metallo-hydrolase [Candidatus Pelagibacter sp.]